MVFDYNKAINPPRPECSITVINPSDLSKSFEIKRAIADTGSDKTWISKSYLEQLKLSIKSFHNVTTATGERSQIPIYLVNLTIAGQNFENIEVFSSPTFTLIGRDILNRYKISFDGRPDFQKWRLNCIGSCPEDISN